LKKYALKNLDEIVLLNAKPVDTLMDGNGKLLPS